MSIENYTISIDCRPNTARPDTYLKIICENIGMNESDFVLTSKTFGEWTWKVNPEGNEKYSSGYDTIERLVTQWHREGKIRYASW